MSETDFVKTLKSNTVILFFDEGLIEDDEVNNNL
jgi:hypothetical protein